MTDPVRRPTGDTSGASSTTVFPSGASAAPRTAPRAPDASAAPSAVLARSSAAPIVAPGIVPSAPGTPSTAPTALGTPSTTPVAPTAPAFLSGASVAPVAPGTPGILPSSFNVEGISIESDGTPRSGSVENVGFVPRKTPTTPNETPETSNATEMDTLSEGNSGHYENQSKGVLLIGPALCLLILLGPLGGGFAFLLTPAQFASFGLLPFFKKDEEQVWVADLSNTPLDSVVRAAERDSLVTAPVDAKDGVIVPGTNANGISRIVDLMKPLVGEDNAKKLGQGLATYDAKFAEFLPGSDLSAKLKSFIENPGDAELKEQVVGKFVDIFKLSPTERENFEARKSLETLKELSSAMDRGSRPAGPAGSRAPRSPSQESSVASL